jgi:hypothetical protein
MIMGDEQMVYLGKAQTVVLELFLQGSDTHAYVNEQAVVISIEKVAIATTSTSKRDESEHVYAI